MQPYFIASAIPSLKTLLDKVLMRGELFNLRENILQAIKNPRLLETRTPNRLFQQLDQKLKDVNFEIVKLKKLFLPNISSI